MKRITRLAALGLVLSVAGTGLFGCGSKEYTEQFDMITNSSSKALEATGGKLEIDEKITAEKDIEGVIKSDDTYTHIQYKKGDTLSYELKRYDDVNADVSYELFTSDMGTFEVNADGDVTPYSGAAPMIFEYISVNFNIDEVESIEVTSGKEGTKLYSVTTTGAYADKFDTALNGGEYDCTLVTYVYQIDSLSRLKSVTTEYMADFTYNGETQKTVRTVKAVFEAVGEAVSTQDETDINSELFLTLCESVAAAEEAAPSAITVIKTEYVKNEDGGYDETASETRDITLPEADGKTVSDYIGIGYEYGNVSAIAVKKIYGADNGGALSANEYIFTMSPFYADRFDTEADGVKNDCISVIYSYVVNVDGTLTTVFESYTYERTEGENVEIVITDVKISL